MAFTGEALLQADACEKIYSPCTISLHPRDDRSLMVSIRQNGFIELVRLLVGGGDPYATFDELYTICWPQARFTFATSWEYNAFKQVIFDAERVFGLRQLQETLERDIGLAVETLEDYAPLPRDWHPTAPTRAKLLQENKAPVSVDQLAPQGLHIDAADAGLVAAATGTSPANSTSHIATTAHSGVKGDPSAPTDVKAIGFVGKRVRCHCCHRFCEETACCPSAGLTAAAVPRLGYGKHAYCASCLLTKGGYDYHAVRTGLVPYLCPVCAGACTCAKCKEKRPGAQSKAPIATSITATAAVHYALSQATKDKYAAAVKKCNGVPMPLTEGMRMRPASILTMGDGKGANIKQTVKLPTELPSYAPLFPEAVADKKLDRWIHKYTFSLAPYLSFFGTSFQGAAGVSGLRAKESAAMGLIGYQARDLLPTVTGDSLKASGLTDERDTGNVVAAASGQRRKCFLCKNTESLTSSRRRLVGVHPLVPVDCCGEPVLICEHCNTDMLRRRMKAAEMDFLHDVKDGYEDICAFCGVGGPENRHVQLHCCSGQLCPRSYCSGCIQLLLPPKAVAAMKEAAEWLCPPCQARHVDTISAELTAMGFPVPHRPSGIGDTLSAVVRATKATAPAASKRKREPTVSDTADSAMKRPRNDNSTEGGVPASTEPGAVVVQNYDPAVYFSHYVDSLRRRSDAIVSMQSEDECFVCKDGGEVVECDCAAGSLPRCPKVYHEDCVGFKIPDGIQWECPRHKCRDCGKIAVLFCRYCPTSLCSAHATRPQSIARCQLWTPPYDVGARTSDLQRNITVMVCGSCRHLFDDAASKGLLIRQPLDLALLDATPERVAHWIAQAQLRM